MSKKVGKLSSRSDARSKELNKQLSRQAFEDIEDLLRQGKIEERAIRCPVCNSVIATTYSDTNSGFLNLKCNKCGVISAINLGVFYSKYPDESMEFKLY